MSRSNADAERRRQSRSCWRTPRKDDDEERVHFGGLDSLQGDAGSSTIGRALSTIDNNTNNSTPATAIATPVTQASEDGCYSPAPIIARPTYSFYDSDSTPRWSVDPDRFIARPATAMTLNAAPIAQHPSPITPPSRVPSVRGGDQSPYQNYGLWSGDRPSSMDISPAAQPTFARTTSRVISPTVGKRSPPDQRSYYDEDVWSVPADDLMSRHSSNVNAASEHLTATHYSAAGAAVSPYPTGDLSSPANGSTDPGDFISRPTSDMTVNNRNVSPITPGQDLSPVNIKSARDHHHRRDLSQDDSVLLWGKDPERAYFEYMLQKEQEQRARQGKPAEDSLLGDSTIEEMLRAGPLAVAEPDGTLQSQSVMGGYSLATTEKSAVPQTAKSMHLSTISSKSPWHKMDTGQQLQPLPAQGPSSPGDDDMPGKILPDVIYVTGKSSTEHSSSKASAGTRPRGRAHHRIFFLAVTFVLCAVMFAGAAVAIYFAKFYEDDQASNSSNLQQQDPSFQTSRPVFAATGVPTQYPTRLGRKTHPPTSMLPTTIEPSAEGSYVEVRQTQVPTTSLEQSAPTMAEIPSDPPTTAAIPSMLPTWHPSELPTGLPSNLPSVAFAAPPAMPPTAKPTAQPTPIPTAQPTTKPTVATFEPTFNDLSECGCQDCVNVLSAFAGGVPCRDRIYFLVVQWAYPEAEACRVVAGMEFPDECSASLCDPTQCVLVDDDPVISLFTPQPTMRMKQQPTSKPTPAVTQPNTLPITAKPTREPTQQPLPTPAPTPRPTLRPTISPSPSSYPTQRPTSLELNLVGNNGVPPEAFPLARCQGDCDRDDDCAPGLVCYQRDQWMTVPGCFGGERDGSKTDYCIPWWATLSPTPRPTPQPTRRETPRPTQSRPALPIVNPTWRPTWSPTWNPTFSPTDAPTSEPRNDGNFVTDITCDLLGIFC